MQVVLVLTPWSDPIPYTRAWCLWEVFNARNTGAKFDIALSPAEEASLAEAVRVKCLEIAPALCQIDARHATASQPADQMMIFNAIEVRCVPWLSSNRWRTLVVWMR